MAVELPHKARRYGYKLKKRFREDPFSVIVLYSVLLSFVFLLFAFRGLIATVFVKPIGIVNPAIQNLINSENKQEEETVESTPSNDTINLKSTGTYTVKSGDTLYSIAQALDIEWQKLAEINNLKEPYSLNVGQELKLPS